MFLTIRKYSGATDKDEVIKRVEQGLKPKFEKFQGFVAYYGVEFEDGGLGGVSVFDTKENAERAMPEVIDWVKENIAEFLPDEPAVHRGEVRIHAGAKSLGKTA